MLGRAGQGRALFSLAYLDLLLLKRSSSTTNTVIWLLLPLRRKAMSSSYNYCTHTVNLLDLFYCL